MNLIDFFLSLMHWFSTQAMPFKSHLRVLQTADVQTNEVKILGEGEGIYCFTSQVILM